MQKKKSLAPLRFTLFIGICGIATVQSRPAWATPTSATSNAYGESVSLTATAVIGGVVTTISSGPLPTASGTAPAPYSITNTLASVTVPNTLSTGVLVAAAASTVDGTAGAKTTSATATVNGLALGLIGGLGLSAATVTSSASISGDFGSLAELGSSTITGLSLLGTAITVGTTPNAVLLNAAGVKITANEQIMGGTANAPDLTVNALDLVFTNALETVGGTLSTVTGEIIISHSEAEMTAGPTVAVPEPGSIWLLGAGLLALTGIAHRTRRMI